MEQILVTVDSNQPLQNIRKAINMLRGVESTVQTLMTLHLR